MMFKKMCAKWFLGGALVLGVLAAPAMAEDNDYNQFRFSAAAEGEVANDLMRVVLVVDQQEKNLGKLASKINQTMQWALDVLEPLGNLQGSTRNYRSYPVYKDQRQVAWRGSQELHIESTDMAQLGEVVGQLQEKLRLQNTHYEAQFGTREVIENNLIAKALEAFRNRAEVLVQSMNAKGYKIVQMDINTQGSAPVLGAPMMMSRAAEMDAAPSMAQSAGNSTLRVEANGRIELLLED